MERKPTHPRENPAVLLQLAGPLRRALAQAGISRLDQLTAYSEKELKHLRGIGPKALEQLRLALNANGLSFAPSSLRSAGRTAPSSQPAAKPSDTSDAGPHPQTQEAAGASRK